MRDCPLDLGMLHDTVTGVGRWSNAQWKWISMHFSKVDVDSVAHALLLCAPCFIGFRHRGRSWNLPSRKTNLRPRMQFACAPNWNLIHNKHNDTRSPCLPPVKITHLHVSTLDPASGSGPTPVTEALGQCRHAAVPCV